MMYLKQLFLIALMATSSYAKFGVWHNIPYLGDIYDTLSSSNGLWMATSGGLRFIDKDHHELYYTPSQGLPSSDFHNLNQCRIGILAVSTQGHIVKLDAKGISVLHSAYDDGKSKYHTGMVNCVKNYLILSNGTQLSFYNLIEERSELTIDRIGNHVLMQDSLRAMMVTDSTWFWAALDSSVYKININLTALSQSRDSSGKLMNLSDPSLWTKVAKENLPSEWKDSLPNQNMDRLIAMNGIAHIPKTIPDGNINQAIPTREGKIVAWSNNHLYTYDGKQWDDEIQFDLNAGGPERMGEPLKTLSTASYVDWIAGTWGAGLYLKKSEGIIQHLDAASSCLSSAVGPNYPVIRGLMEDVTHQGFWISYFPAQTLESGYGLAFVDNLGNMECFSNVGKSSIGGILHWIYPDSVLGVSSKDGMDLFSVVGNGIGSFQVSYLKSYNSVEYRDLRDIDHDDQNRIWMMSPRLFSLWDLNTDSVTNVGSLLGLTQQIYTGLQIDRLQNVWLTTSGSGIYSLSANKEISSTNILHYTMHDGVLSNNVLDVAIDSLTGYAWFAHSNGLSYLETPGRIASTMTGKANPIAFPNPFNPKTQDAVIFDHLPISCNMVIWNGAGKRIRDFGSKECEGGQIKWDGRDRKGVLVPAGVYYYTHDDVSKVKFKGRLIVVH